MTALYEIVPPGEPLDGAGVDPLKYQRRGRSRTRHAKSDELMTVKLRYKQPDGDTSQLISVAVTIATGELTPNLGFAAAVAEFGMLLRKSEFKGQATWATAAGARAATSRRRSGWLPRRVRAADRSGGRARRAEHDVAAERRR